MKKNYIIILIVLTFPVVLHAQSHKLEGLWGVENVMVGEENLTPVSKWFRMNSDGTYQAGNGWLQNGSGTWQYDEEEKIFSAYDSLEIAHDYGGFEVTFENGHMFWEREEEGMHVKVNLYPIDQLPMSPADYLKGVWDLVQITENGHSILEKYDKEDRHKIFFRWDRIYINFSPDQQRLTGYWHINGHRPVITLLPHQDGKEAESWTIEVNKKELVMRGASDSNEGIERKYERTNSY